MRSPLHPTVEDLQAFIGSSLVVAVCFLAYKEMGLPQIPYVILISGIVVFFREAGQRMVAQWMDAYIDLEFSMEGAGTSLFGALMAYLTGFSIILLFPLTSSFSGRKYEHWGKSVDAIWAKRQYWLAFGGLTTLFGGWYLAYIFEYQLLAELASLFLFFQLMPFDYEYIPTDRLDGAYILLWSGFTWLISMGVTIIALVLTFY